MDTLEEQLQLRAVLDKLRMNMLKAQQRQEVWADKKRTNEEFVVGDWVLIRLQPYRQQSLARWAFEKLSPRFYGPYLVE